MGNRYNLVELKSIKDVKEKDILSRSADGLVIVTTDGLKVSDELIAQAKTDARAQSAASATRGGGGLSEADVRRMVRSEMQEMISHAVPSENDIRGIVKEEMEAANALSEADVEVNIRSIAADEVAKALAAIKPAR